MIVRKFLAWAPTAPPALRATAAGALAHAFVCGELQPAEEAEAEMALTSLLEDPHPIVRQALANELALAPNAPHHLIVALANDQSEIAAPVLGHSPRLTDSDLIDCAAIGNAFAQSAIALRPRLSPPVAAALAEVGAREAVIALTLNEGAELPAFSLARIIERFGEDGETREALLARADLPLALRARLVDAAARALSRFVVACDWLSDERAQRAAREAREKATIMLAAEAGEQPDGPGQLVRHLREQNQLTAGLVLRALLSGNRDLFEAALAELSGVDRAKVAGHVAQWRGAGFAALFARAGLPATLTPAFRAALAAQEEFGFGVRAPEAARLSRMMIERVLTACEREGAESLAPVMSLLRRFEAEAAREDARELSQTVARDNPPALAAPHVDVIGGVRARLVSKAA